MIKKRQSLVRLVFEKHLSIAKAGRRLHIKPSTAKLIIKKYRLTGTFFIKKTAPHPPNPSPHTQNQVICESQEVENEENGPWATAQTASQHPGQDFSYLYYPRM